MRHILPNPMALQEADPETEAFLNNFVSFLSSYEEQGPTDARPVRYYLQELERMRAHNKTTLYVNCSHLLSSEENMGLYQELHERYYQLEPVACRAVSHFAYSICPDFAKTRTFHVGFINLFQVDAVRDMKSSKLGQLIALKGTVTKSSEVRPELLEGQFKCEECGARSDPVPQQFAFTLPRACLTRGCTNKTKFDLIKESSRYIDWQKLRLQELDSDLPAGSTPRSIDVVLRNEQVERAQPGDRLIVIGTLIVVPDLFSMIKPGEKFELSKISGGMRTHNMQNFEGISGLSSLGVRDLNYKMIFLANSVQVNEKRMSGDNVTFEAQTQDMASLLERMTQSERNEIDKIAQESDLLSKLSSLIAPSVFGNREIKKGILLMLAGGVTKITPESMKLRGDINLCIVGDPATAKSQFLKFVHKFVPRTVYTSGKGSTAAGLTASISRDPESGEFTIEAGALILADNGICCIDEFDKMDEKDVVAIHEAMEQQTISLSKAGIQATLNARCSILAAANPIFGRYDKSKSLKANVKLTPPLMSRFDLFFILTDECNTRIDTFLASHIISIHKNFKKDTQQLEKMLWGVEGAANPGSISQAALLRYLKFVRHINPEISDEAAHFLERGFLRLRTNELSVHKSSYRVTVRQLESLIRLSEAIARVHAQRIVTKAHVEMAFDLLSKSMVGIQHPDVNIEEEDPPATSEPAVADPSQSGDATVQAQLPKKKRQITLPFEEYQRIYKILVNILGEVPGNQLPRSELISVFLSKDIARIQSELQLSEMEKLVAIVIRQMAEKENVLLVLPNDQNSEDPLIGLHSQVFSQL